MILKSVYLYPSLLDYPVELTSSIRYETRGICNYIERALKSIKYNSEGYDRVCFVGVENPARIFVNTANVLEVEVPFDVDEYGRIDRDLIGSYYEKMILSGLSFVDGKVDFPVSDVRKLLESYRSCGYINKWLFKSKKYRKTGIEVSLYCEINLSEFKLDLVVSKAGEVVFDSTILVTRTEEQFYKGKFKDVKYLDGEVCVVDARENEIFRVRV